MHRDPKPANVIETVVVQDELGELEITVPVPTRPQRSIPRAWQRRGGYQRERSRLGR